MQLQTVYGFRHEEKDWLFSHLWPKTFLKSHRGGLASAS